MDFFAFSGWIIALISLIVAILQYLKKEKYKKQIVEMQQTNKNSTGYQAGGNITVNN